MYRYTIELRAANPKCQFHFEQEDKKLIEQAIKVCNTSANFKANKKKINLGCINADSIDLELISMIPLEKPLLSLRGLSRKLLENNKFDKHLYRGSLFNGEIKESHQDVVTEELDDIEAMQEIVRIIFGTDKKNKDMKEKLIKIATEHRNNRL